MSDTAEILRTVDWDFSKAKVSKGVHSLHSYPAKFIPEIPRKLIELFHPGDSSPVLDPFCGSGTTLVESVQAGIDAIGIDVNPLACLISKVKTRQLPAEYSRTGSEVMSKAQQTLKSNQVVIPDIPNLNHWFAPPVQRALAALVAAIKLVEQIHVQEALLVALSRIIVNVSYQESDTRYAAVHKEFAEGDVLSNFRNSISFVGSSLASTSQFSLVGKFGQATVLNRDILSLKPEELPNDIGLVVTSPPYPNAYEYWLYHKYRMYWLGMDPIETKKHEIGARPHYFKRRHQTEVDFENQMSICFGLLAKVMKQGRKACFVLSNSTIHGKEIDNLELLTRASKSQGFAQRGVVRRKIPDYRRSFNIHRDRKGEFLMIFEKE